MKKLALVLALTIAAFAGSAYAQYTWVDNIGIYVDEAASNNCVTAAPYTPFPAYLICTHLDSPDINAWEMGLIYTNVTSLSFAPRGVAIDAAVNPGEHIVGLASPLAVAGGTVVIADMQLMVTNTSAAGIKITNTFFHSLPAKVPAYQGTATPIRELRPITAPGQPVLSINSGCPVAEETSSFGNVKSLFR